MTKNLNNYFNFVLANTAIKTIPYLLSLTYLGEVKPFLLTDKADCAMLVMN